MFLTGLALWAAAVVVIFVTGNANLIPTVVLLGSFLAPVGHGLWTAILGGVLFAASRPEHFRINAKSILAYLGVSILHALWDSMHSIALYLTLTFTEGEQFVATPHGWLVEPTAEQVNVFTALEWGGLVVVSIVGIAWLLVLWRRTPRPIRISWGTARSPVAPTLGS